MENKELMKELVIMAEDALSKLSKEDMEELVDIVKNEGYQGLTQRGEALHALLAHFHVEEEVDLSTMLMFGNEVLEIIEGFEAETLG